MKEEKYSADAPRQTSDVRARGYLVCATAQTRRSGCCTRPQIYFTHHPASELTSCACHVRIARGNARRPGGGSCTAQLEKPTMAWAPRPNGALSSLQQEPQTSGRFPLDILPKVAHPTNRPRHPGLRGCELVLFMAPFRQSSRRCVGLRSSSLQSAGHCRTPTPNHASALRS